MPLNMFKEKEKRRPTAPTYVVAIAAGKGGVGKSTVTANLALTLKRAGYAVGILDADIYGPSIRTMLPEDTMPQQQGEKIIPAVCKGIKMISMAYFRSKGEAAAVRAPIANSVLSQFIHQVDWGLLDFLLIDFPPGTGDIQITLSQQAGLTGAVMVTTPQEIAVMDVRKAAHLFEQVNIPMIGVVENMSYYTDLSGERRYLFGRGGGERLSREIGAPLLGEIPIDPEVCRCGDAGIDFLSQAGGISPAAQAIQEISEAFVAHAALLKRASEGCLTAFSLKWEEKG